jgi:hypothetical protein
LNSDKAELSGANFTGSIDVTGTVTADGLTVDGTIASPSIIKISNSGGTWTPGDEIGRIQFYSADGSGIGAHEAASIRAVTNQGGVQTDGTLEFWRSPYNSSVVKALEIDGPTGDISFYDAAGSSQALFYDASAERLGLGTTSPAREVHVSTAGQNGVRLTSTAFGADFGLLSSVGGTNGFGIYDYTASAYRLNVDSSGNVGISVTDPIYPLEVQGEAGIELYNASGGGDVLNLRPSLGDANKYNMSISSYDHSGNGVGPADGISINAFDGVSVATGSSTARQERMRIDASGAFLLNPNNATRGLKITTTQTIAIGDTTTYDTIGAGYGSHVFKTDGTERLRIDSSGNVGIGTSSPSHAIDVSTSATTWAGAIKNTDATNGFGLFLQSAESASKAILGAYSGSSYKFYVRGDGNVGIGTSTPQASIHTTGDAIIGTATHGASYEGVLQIADGAVNGRTAVLIYNNHPDQFMKLGQDVNTAFIGRDDADEFAIGLFDNAADTTMTKQFVIDASGNVLVGATAFASAGGGHLLAPSGTRSSSRTVTTAAFHNLFYNANGIVGGISTSGSATTFATSSDQRLKDNIVDAPSASDDIDAIQVRSFDWKVDGSHQKYGMVAQELQSVAPESVSEGETEDDMMGVDYSKLVPMLVKEIQSLRARVAQLETN